MHRLLIRSGVGLALSLWLVGCQKEGLPSQADSAVSLGGSDGTGSVPAAGGNSGRGGAQSGGGAFGTGGQSTSGGTVGAGGHVGTGGDTGSGGTTRNGGAPGSGGTTASGGAVGSGGTQGTIIDAGICLATALPPDATACTTDSDCEVVVNYTCCITSYHGLAKAAPQYRACYHTTPVTGCTMGCADSYVADDNMYVIAAPIPTAYVHCQVGDAGARECRTTFGKASDAGAD